MTMNPGNQPSEPQPASGQEQTPSSGSPQPEYITKQDFAQFVQSIRSEMSKNYQGVQSLTDKVRNEIRTFDAAIQRLTQTGVKLDQNMVNNARAAIMADGMAATEAPATQQNPAVQPGQPVDPTQDAIFARIEAVQASHGIELLDEDPEVETLPDINEVGEKVFFQKLGEALTAKKLRVANDTPARAQARAPVLGAQGSPSSNPLQGLKQDQLWETYRREKGF